MTRSEYSETLAEEIKGLDKDGDRIPKTPANKLILSLKRSDELLFVGKESIQPIRIYQVRRIYQLAMTFIDVIAVIWPYISVIFKILKK